MKSGLTVLIPVIDEQDIIEANTLRLLDYLRNFGQVFEIIIVSNGSTDSTSEIGRRLDRTIEEVRFFEIPARGVGRAFSQGVDKALYDQIISLDMDLSIELDFIPRALVLLSEYQIVVGSKKMGSQNRSFWRMAGSTAFILTARLLVGLPYKDYSIAAKGYHREMILKYLDRIDDGTSYVMDIIYHAQKDGKAAVEIPVFCEDYRPSKFNLLDEARYRFRNVFLLWWRYHIRKPKNHP